MRADYEPGLHFMTPLVNNVRKFDKRVLTEDYPAESFLTSEGKILTIDFFVKWRISDVSRYYTSTAGGSEEVAARRLGEIVKDGLKGVIARRTIQQVVAAERSEFLGEVLKIAGANVGGLGMTMIDVRVKSIGLPDEVSESVFNRMSQDFARQAAQLRAEGYGGVRADPRRGRPPAHRDPRERLPRRREGEGRGRRHRRGHLRARPTGAIPSSIPSTGAAGVPQVAVRQAGRRDGADARTASSSSTSRRPAAERGRPRTVQWGDLWAAFALYLVLEGLMPFLNPGGMKGTLSEARGAPGAACCAWRGWPAWSRARCCSTSCAAAPDPSLGCARSWQGTW